MSSFTLDIELSMSRLFKKLPMKNYSPPIAAKHSHKISIHGETWTDDYFWLREKKNPEVIRYLIAENEYTAHFMKPFEGLVEKLNREMVGRLYEDDQSAPVRIGSNYYYSKHKKGLQYEIYCRRLGGMQANEHVVLDVNELARGKKYMRVGDFEISPDQRFLAYSSDTKGDELFTIRIKDLATGLLLRDKIELAYYSMAWSADNRSLFYTKVDSALRPYQVWRHVIGTAEADDKLIWEEKDERFTVGVTASKDRQYIFLEIHSMLTSEVRFLDEGGSSTDLKIVEPRRQGVEYDVAHRAGTFYIRVNDKGRNFRLVTVPTSSCSRRHWKELIPHDPAVCIESVDEFQDHLALETRENGLQKILVHNCRSGTSHKVRFTEPTYSVKVESNPEFNSNTLRFIYGSLITPPTVFDYNMNSRRRELVKEDRVRGGYSKENYRTERVFASAPDGTKVPISICYRKDVKRDGKAPALLYAYGSYGFSRDVEFSPGRLSLLDRGFVFAIAHIRGGAEMGETWHDSGKLLKKKNTFTDFITCAEYLIKKKYTSTSKLTIQGGSAGGLLMGAVLNMRPDLFNSAVAMVPFVDVISTMLDASLPLTVGEYEEWGDPNVKKFYKYMKSYSPYDNVQPKAYPNVLVTAGLNDPRVQYWEPAKWVAKLRAANTSENLLLLRTNMGGGHFGKSGRYDKFREVAFEYAFMLRTAGITR